MALSAQDFTYAHFDTRDGLAGSTVYDVCQDNDGFIWFATENGLSRYDGAGFRNYTVKDGLPDNEVLYLHADRKGRIWIGTFSKEICYYYKGKIHNRYNDALLKQFHLRASLRNALELNDGTMYFGDGLLIYELKANNQVRDLSLLPAFQEHRFAEMYLSPQLLGSQILVSSSDSVFLFANDSLSFWKKKLFQAVSDSVNIDIDLNRVVVLPRQGTTLREVVEHDKTTFVATMFGAWEIDTITFTLAKQYLKDKVVTDVMTDVEQNTWFTTLGSGVYKLASRQTRTIQFAPLEEVENTEVFSLLWHRNKLFCGLGLSEVAILDGQLNEIKRLNLK
nr:hypothetical protein [Chitinophagaceae bacterium]